MKRNTAAAALLGCLTSTGLCAQTAVVTPPLQQPYGSSWDERDAPNKVGPVAIPPPPADRSSECNTDCLTQLMQRYLNALSRRDYTGLPVSPNLLVAENGHATRIGEGIWKVLETLDPERTVLTDPVAGQILMIGTLQMSDHQPFIFIVRLKVEKRLIAEVESMVTADVNAAQHFRPDNLAHFDPETLAVLAPELRLTRQQLLAAGTQMLLGGGLKLSVDPGCIHWENGDRLALFNCGVSEAARTDGTGLVYDNRAVRHVLVDVERGLVVSFMLKDTSPYLNPNPPDNERTPLFYQRPLTLYALQLLKVETGNRLLAHQLFMNAQEASLPAVFVPSGVPMPAGGPPLAAVPGATTTGGARCPPYPDGGTYDASPIADAIDVNHDGRLTHAEWQRAGAPEDSWKRFMSYPAEKAQGYITRAQFIAETPPDGIDANCDHRITLQEFLDFSKTMAPPPRS